MKAWMDAMRPPATSRTTRTNGSNVPSASASVLGDGRRAVGADRDEPGAPTRRLAAPPRGDVVGALQPEVVRRHRQRGVVVEQVDERVDVVALEGVDVALEQARWRRRVERPRRAGEVASAIVARARCSALFTDVTVVSSSSATSGCSTAARRGGSAPPVAGGAGAAARRRRRAGGLPLDRRLGRVDVGRARTRASGIGPTHVRPGRGDRQRRSSADDAGPRSIGRARRPRPRACRGTRWWRCGRARTSNGPRPS